MDHEELRRALAAADAAYVPFAPFSAWAQEPLSVGSWDDAASHLAAVREDAPVDEVNARLDEVLRAAAVDTGAIEGLYATNRGFTMSVARNLISMDQAEVEAGSGFRGSFEAQLAGFEHAVRLATEGRPLTETDIRDLHRITCAEQTSYRVITEHGVQERELVSGTYKSDPNHVQLGDGSWHSYAPPDEVPIEVHRLVQDAGSTLFRSAPAVVQAAFVHHAFTSIHPFSDGNGRVARLLASGPLLRSASIPLWVEDADKGVYLDALRRADDGDRQPFLRLVTSLSLRLMRELSISLTAAEDQPDPDPASHAALQRAAEHLAGQIRSEMARDHASQMMYPIPVMPDVPRGIDVPFPQAALAFNTAGLPLGGGTRAVALGLDHLAEEWDRVCVLVFDNGLDGKLTETHRFELAELDPQLSPSAIRRLDALARSLTAASRRAARDP